MKILLIDDEADIRKIAKLSLEAVGKHQTVMAASAAEGLLLAESEQPDAIIMDMMMPGMDGLTALAELRKNPRTASIPVIFMTAKVQRFEAHDYVQHGAVGVICKPFEPMSLPAEIAKLLGHAQED